MPNASAATSSATATEIPSGPLDRPGFWVGSSTVLPVAVLVGLTILWEVGVRVFQPPGYLLPAPSTIAHDTWALGPVMIDHTLTTLRTVTTGFFVSLLISLPLAVIISASPWLANAIYPLLVLTQSVPKIAIAPILVVALGAGEVSRVTVTVLVAFFPLVLSIATGLAAVPPELIELGRSLRAGKLQELFRIRLPYAVPFVFSGLKLAITFALVGAVVGEFVAAEKGLGYQILSATAFFKTPVAFGALVILSVMGIVLFQAVAIVERVFFPWAVREEAKLG